MPIKEITAQDEVYNYDEPEYRRKNSGETAGRKSSRETRGSVDIGGGATKQSDDLLDLFNADVAPSGGNSGMYLCYVCKCYVIYLFMY